MNNDKKKAIVYPFVDGILPMLQYLNQKNGEMIVTTVIDKKRKFLNGKDAGYIENQPDTGIRISADFETELNQCDILIYTDEMSESVGQEEAFHDIGQALRIQKKVICLRHISNLKILELDKIASIMRAELHFWKGNNQEAQEQEWAYIPNELYHPEAVVITVGEMFRGLNGENICFSLWSAMKSLGYKCTVVTEHKYTQFLGIHQYPVFLKSLNITENNKIYYFNNFIKNIDQTEKPDIIIMLMPDAMLKYNDMFGNGFGIIPYLISQAVQTDYFVYCAKFDELESRFFELLSINFSNRFGFEIDFIHMSNKMLDGEESRQRHSLSFLYRTQASLNRLIANRYQNVTIPIFNGLDKEQGRKLVDAVIDKMENHYQVNSITV